MRPPAGRLQFWSDQNRLKFMKEWSTQDAKARFSELMEASQEEPVFVTRHVKPRVVVLSPRAFQRLRGTGPVNSPLRRFYERVRGDTNWEPERMPNETVRRVEL